MTVAAIVIAAILITAILVAAIAIAIPYQLRDLRSRPDTAGNAPASRIHDDPEGSY
jgi:hypothetical protein